MFLQELVRYLKKKGDLRNASLPEMVRGVIRQLRQQGINMETQLRSRRRDENIEFLQDSLILLENETRATVRFNVIKRKIKACESSMLNNRGNLVFILLKRLLCVV